MGYTSSGIEQKDYSAHFEKFEGVFQLLASNNSNNSNNETSSTTPLPTKKITKSSASDGHTSDSEDSSSSSSSSEGDTKKQLNSLEARSKATQRRVQ